MKTKSIKEIEKLIKENNLCPCYLKIGSYYYAFQTLEQFNNAFKALKK